MDPFFAAFTPGLGGLWNFLTTKNLSMVRIGSPLTKDAYVIDAKSADTVCVHAGLEPVWLASLVDPTACDHPDRDILLRDG